MNQANDIQNWILSANAAELDLGEWFEQLVRRLDEAGLGLIHAATGLLTLHPEVSSRTFVWKKGEGMEVTQFTHDRAETSTWQENPAAEVIDRGRALLRVGLTLPDKEIRYPICREIKARGGTDYAIWRMPAIRGIASGVGLATDLREGWSDEQIAFVSSLVPACAHRLEIESLDEARTDLLRTYLGPNASRRVLEGAFRRGTGEQIEAAIMLCDLRGFTSLVEHSDIHDVLKSLDQFFEVVAEPVERHGGEILKFMGDAVLAIFPMAEQGARAACQASVAATREAIDGARLLNPERHAADASEIHFGIGLHVGEVMYGNIGAEGRLDFTVIGRAVNETVRIEELCKELASPVLLSGEFAALLDPEQMGPLGRYRLSDAGARREIYTLTMT